MSWSSAPGCMSAAGKPKAKVRYFPLQRRRVLRPDPGPHTGSALCLFHHDVAQRTLYEGLRKTGLCILLWENRLLSREQEESVLLVKMEEDMKMIHFLLVGRGQEKDSRVGYDPLCEK